jgi:REP element-mobilizing transposase RayT
MYHAMNRGERLEAIFCDEDDRVLFVATLAESLGKTALGIQSVCLMSNHFHLMVETPNASLVEGMKGLLGVLGAGC